MTRLSMSKPASQQIDEIHRYIAHDSNRGADNVVAALDAAFDLLTRHPKIGRRTLRKNLRMYALPDYPYLIYFQYLPRVDELRIRAVRHAARRRAVELRDPAGEFRASAIS